MCASAIVDAFNNPEVINPCRPVQVVNWALTYFKKPWREGISPGLDEWIEDNQDGWVRLSTI